MMMGACFENDNNVPITRPPARSASTTSGTHAYTCTLSHTFLLEDGMIKKEAVREKQVIIIGLLGYVRERRKTTKNMNQ